MRAFRSLSGYVASLGLAIVLAVVPVAPALCGVTCAAHETAAAMVSEHHSCHPPSENEAGVRPAPHACDHRDESSQIGPQELIQVVSPPAVVAPSSMTTLLSTGLQWHVLRPSHGDRRPPGSHPLITQLRV